MAQQLGNRVNWHVMIDEIGGQGVTQAMGRDRDLGKFGPPLEAIANPCRAQGLAFINPKVVVVGLRTMGKIGGQDGRKVRRHKDDAGVIVLAGVNQDAFASKINVAEPEIEQFASANARVEQGQEPSPVQRRTGGSALGVGKNSLDNALAFLRFQIFGQDFRPFRVGDAKDVGGDRQFLVTNVVQAAKERAQLRATGIDFKASFGQSIQPRLDMAALESLPAGKRRFIQKPTPNLHQLPTQTIRMGGGKMGLPVAPPLVQISRHRSP